MDDQLSQFVLDKSFPCIMAKAVVKTGLIKIIRINGSDFSVETLLENLYLFVDDYRKKPQKLRSFIVVFDDEESKTFEGYEKNFWKLISQMSLADKKLHPHDTRVSDNPQDPNFSYSVKSEAFFILGLHPQSPRLARRFFRPAIVFNLHQQFEDMRKKGIFSKVRNLIRKKDQLLQGTPNPMLSDFGEKSEIFQYLGKVYESVSELNMQKGFSNASY